MFSGNCKLAFDFLIPAVIPCFHIKKPKMYRSLISSLEKRKALLVQLSEKEKRFQF